MGILRRWEDDMNIRMLKMQSIAQISIMIQQEKDIEKLWAAIDTRIQSDKDILRLSR